MNTKRIFGIVAVAAIMFSVTSCGGGGSKSGLKKNEYFGNLPALYADFQLTEQAGKEKKEQKMKNITDIKKLANEMLKFEKIERERREKFDNELAAETAKINGKDIPFTFSQALQNSNYEIKAAKVKGNSFCVDLFAHKVQKNLIGVRSIDVGFRLISKDGSTIKAQYLTMYGPEENGIKEFCFDAVNAYSAEAMVNFASIEFITKEEAEKYQKEAVLR